jgi:hypothetical protein
MARETTQICDGKENAERRGQKRYKRGDIILTVAAQASSSCIGMSKGSLRLEARSPR